VGCLTAAQTTVFEERKAMKIFTRQNFAALHTLVGRRAAPLVVMFFKFLINRNTIALRCAKLAAFSADDENSIYIFGFVVDECADAGAKRMAAGARQRTRGCLA
jgi:hypothetical protein